jgi:hypothetical protein
MTITFYDGFEGYQNQGFTLPSAAELDMGKYWYLNTLYPIAVTNSSYLFGVAAAVNGGLPWRFDRTSAGVTPGTTELRLGAWVLPHDPQSSSNTLEIFRFRSDTYAFVLRTRNGGDLSFARLTDPNESSTPVAEESTWTAAGLIETGTWVHIEYYVDFTTGVNEVRLNGVLVHSWTATGVSTPTWITPNLGDWRYTDSIANVPWDFRMDHLYMTDGPALPTDQDILAVGVFAIVDHIVASSNPGLKGTLTIGSTLYQHSTKTQAGSSNGTTSNFANGVHWQWMTDPSDGQPWSQSKLDNVTFFGLCYGATTASGTMRVDNLFLTYLDYNSGMPLVRYYAPDVVDTIDTVWTRSDTGETFAGHVDDIPRTGTQNLTLTDNLYCAEPGCIRFRYNQPDPPILVTGITFAEEFREDYLDWVRVLGSDGLDYESYFISGYGIYGEGNKQFQNNYVTVNYENVASGAAYIQGLWDYTLDPNTGRWSMQQRVYKDNLSDSDYKHGTRKLKIRGSGKALQLRVLSESGKPFTINGWSLLVTGETAV